MPFYEFQCEECGHIEEFRRRITEGPPKRVVCPKCILECQTEEECASFPPMIQIFGGNFILKGSWPGKDMKKFQAGAVKEKNDQQFEDDNRNKRVVEDVMATRRKGKTATRKLQEENPQKMADYQSAMKKGHRAKGKSYGVNIGE